MSRVERDGLQVDQALAAFIEEQALPDSGVDAAAFWAGFSALIHEFGPDNRALLERRETLQQQIDAWHVSHQGQPVDAAAYTAFLREIGYLVPEGPDFDLQTATTDPEFATTPGPQLVVPIMNARFALNAANARWGSLYDALYGTDALGDLPAGSGYDPARGARVVAWAKAHLDEVVPLADGSWADLTDVSTARLADPSQYVGRSADGRETLYRRNGLHIRVVVDADHPIGKGDPAHIADVICEAAVSSIMDCEDSVAAVDAEDKVLAYANWLGLMRGDLSEEVTKGGTTFTRALNPDLEFIAPDGSSVTL